MILWELQVLLVPHSPLNNKQRQKQTAELSGEWHLPSHAFGCGSALTALFADRFRSATGNAQTRGGAPNSAVHQKHNPALPLAGSLLALHKQRTASSSSGSMYGLVLFCSCFFWVVLCLPVNRSSKSNHISLLCLFCSLISLLFCLLSVSRSFSLSIESSLSQREWVLLGMTFGVIRLHLSTSVEALGSPCFPLRHQQT